MQNSMSSSRAVAWTIWMIASIFYAYQYILRVMPNIMIADIMEHFQLDAASFGQFSGVYYIGYALIQVPIGLMLDRYGARKVMTICILLTVIGLLPLIFADHWIYPIVGRLLIGIGSSAAILGVFKMIRTAFKERLFPRMLSISVTIGLLGAIYGGGPVSYMCDALGYLAVVKIFALVGVILALTTFLIVPNMKSVVQTTPFAAVKEVLSNRSVVISCLCAGLMVGPLEGFADVWGTVFLKQVYGLDGTVAAGLPSMIFIGMCFGAPILSLIADKMGYLKTIIGAGIVMAFGFISLIIWNLSSILITGSFILIGVCCAYQILAIYKASTYVREEVVGVTTAIANMIIMIFGYGFHTLIGSIVDAMGGPQVAQALIGGMVVIPIALTVGTVGFIGRYLHERSLKKSRDLA